MADFDVIVAGGGLGGAALARLLAANGVRVLVVERERQFKDRIRGEWMAPWGVAEAQKIGIHDLLMESCAHENPYFAQPGRPARDFRTTTPQRLPALTFYHPAMQEVVLEAAQSAGAEVRRGATVREVKPGATPAVALDGDGPVAQLKARIVVCADGRSSMGRVWGGFSPQRGRQRMLGAGVMLDNLAIADDTSVAGFNPILGRFALLFPQGAGRVRAYLIYPPDSVPRFQGDADVARFIDESVKTGIVREAFAGARSGGPLASFDMTETWVDHPYRDGIVLIGDAAGATDPTWGQGLSLTVRDVRVLAENLLTSDDWEEAGHAYAREHDRYFTTTLTSEDWSFEMFLDQSHQARKQRIRALPLLLAEPERGLDHAFSGPDLPCDESVRKRFFGLE
ncbi:MAG TPA: FAD-dependent monooxygenase [Candidatus Binataceae bacterium]|nr:FAD-dependent monooxygenase [Candidatus Binataceae bacterium]